MIDLVYIASPSYSGSTLLTFLLNAHPEIATIGELKWGTIDWETYRCSCGALLRECDFWREVQSKVQAQGLNFDLLRPDTDFRLREHALTDRILRARNGGAVFENLRDAAIALLPASRRSWPTIAAINRAAISAILELQDASIFVDASKDPVRLRHLLRTGDYRVRVIQLIRDGRGVTWSTIKNKKLSLREAAEDWAKTHGQIERLANVVGPDNYLALRYEDLCTKLSDCREKIFDFIGVDAAAADNDYRRAEHHILGNSMRLSPDGEIRLDEKWRDSLSDRQLAEFERIAGQRNRNYGYQ